MKIGMMFTKSVYKLKHTESMSIFLANFPNELKMDFKTTIDRSWSTNSNKRETKSRPFWISMIVSIPHSVKSISALVLLSNKVFNSSLKINRLALDGPTIGRRASSFCSVYSRNPVAAARRSLFALVQREAFSETSRARCPARRRPGSRFALR